MQFTYKFYPFRSYFAMVHNKPLLQETLYGQGLFVCRIRQGLFLQWQAAVRVLCGLLQSEILLHLVAVPRCWSSICDTVIALYQYRTLNLFFSYVAVWINGNELVFIALGNAGIFAYSSVYRIFPTAPNLCVWKYKFSVFICPTGIHLLDKVTSYEV